MTALARHWDRFWFAPISPSPVAIFRMIFGALSLVNALYYIPDFAVWFCRDGASPLHAVAQLRPVLLTKILSTLQPGDAFYWSVLGVHVLSSLTVLLGFYTRTSLVVLWVSRLLIFNRNPYLWHQIDILLRIYGLLLLCCPAGERYSVDDWLRRRAKPGLPRRHFAPWGQRLIQLQMSLIYAEAFLGKIVSFTWLNGSAVYYAMHFPDGLRHTVPGFLDHAWFYSSLTYFTLLIEFSLFVLVWIKPLRYPILIGGVFFHLGIHWYLNLDLLELGAMMPFVCFLDPVDLERWIESARRRLLRLGPAQAE